MAGIFIIGSGFDGRPSIVRAPDADVALDLAIKRFRATAVIEHPMSRMAWAVPSTPVTQRWFLIPTDMPEAQ